MPDNLWLVVQLAIGLLFLRAGLGKLSDIEAFLKGVMSYGLVPEQLLPAAGASLIISEVAIGISHLVGWHLIVTVPFAIALLSIFVLLVSFALKHRPDVPCMCFGGSTADSVSVRTLARLALVLVAELSLWSHVLSAHAVSVLNQTVRDTFLMLLTAVAGLLIVSWILALLGIGASKFQG
jgi:uncharacterized membrane protein YphA (DoxX/SURF4 family)